MLHRKFKIFNSRSERNHAVLRERKSEIWTFKFNILYTSKNLDSQLQTQATKIREKCYIFFLHWNGPSEA